MTFIKQLFSKVAIAVAAGAAEQVGRNAISDAWKKYKQSKDDRSDADLANEQAPTPTNPITKFFTDKWSLLKEAQEARDFVNKDKSTSEEETSEETS